VHLLGGLELRDDAGEPLRQGVMDLAGHPLALVEHARLPGLGEQPGVQDGVLGERRLQQPVRPAQLFEGLLAPLVLLLGEPQDPGAAAHHGDVEGDDGHVHRQAERVRPGDAGHLRRTGQDRRGGHAQQPPRPAQDREGVDVGGRGEEPESGVTGHQDRGDHEQPRDEHPHDPWPVPPSGTQGEHAEHPRGRQPAQAEVDE